MNIPIDRWTIAITLTFIALHRAGLVKSKGVYDFTPGIAALVAIAVVVSLWVGVLLATFL